MGVKLDQDHARGVLLLRITSMKLQLPERLTPLMRKEMEQIVKTHTEALEQLTLTYHGDGRAPRRPQ